MNGNLRRDGAVAPRRGRSELPVGALPSPWCRSVLRPFGNGRTRTVRSTVTVTSRRAAALSVRSPGSCSRPALTVRRTDSTEATRMDGGLPAPRSATRISSTAAVPEHPDSSLAAVRSICRAGRFTGTACRALNRADMEVVGPVSLGRFELTQSGCQLPMQIFAAATSYHRTGTAHQCRTGGPRARPAAQLTWHQQPNLMSHRSAAQQSTHGDRGQAPRLQVIEHTGQCVDGVLMS